MEPNTENSALKPTCHMNLDNHKEADDPIITRQATQEAPTNIEIGQNNYLPRCSNRIQRFPMNLDDFVATCEFSKDSDLKTIELENLNYEQAINDLKWQKAMEEELTAIAKMGTWSLIELPHSIRPISCKWVFRVRLGTNSNPPSFKARFLLLEGLSKC